MNEPGSFIASILESSARAFAAGAVSRMTDLTEESSLLDHWAFGEVVADTELRVRNLAEALAVGRPEVFQLDVDWLRSTYVARGVPAELVRTTLTCLRDELLENLPEDSRDTVRQYIEAALDSSEGELQGTVLEGGGALDDLARRFVVAALEGRRSAAEQVVLSGLDDGVSISELHHGVLARAQVEIGRMWQAGEVNIAEEHLSSRIVEDVLAVLRSRMPRPDDINRRVVVASVAGNLHEIGARMVSDHFEMAGWKALFLGADTPAEDLVRILEAFDAELVALSSGLGLNLRATARMIELIRERRPGLAILVGGRPFSLVPDLWKDVGADGWAADAESAVVEGTRLAKR